MMLLLTKIDWLNMLTIIFLSIILAGSILVIFFKNPIYKLLLLIPTGFMTGIIWINLNADFLSFILLLLYIGLIVVLFLCLIMMFDIKTLSDHQFSIKKYRSDYKFIVSSIVTIILALIFSYIVKDYILPVNFKSNMQKINNLIEILLNNYNLLFILIGICGFGIVIMLVALEQNYIQNSKNFNNIFRTRKKLKMLDQL